MTGILVDSVDEALGEALVSALSREWDAPAIAAEGRRHRWESTAERVETVLSSLEHRGGRA
jgi:hypothetical protein